MPKFTVDISAEIEDFRTLVGGKRSVGDASMIGNLSVLNMVGGSVAVSGIPEVMANWQLVSKGIQDTCYAQLRDAAALIEIQSSIEVPYLSGALQAALRRDESEVIDAEASGGASGPVRIYVYYDADAVIGEDGRSYAWRQHEDMSYNHPQPGTKAKFLEDPFKEVAELFPEMCEGAVQKGLSSGLGAPRLRKKGS